MARNQFSDITPKKRSIRDIPLPAGKHFSNQIPADAYFADLGTVKYEEKKGKKKFIIIIILALVFWGGSVVLHAATVRVSPDKTEFSGTLHIEAKADAAPTEIQYDSLQFVESASKKVVATSEETVSLKASGKMMIYNNYSNVGQELIAKTRFETKDGKIYRIDKAVTVPGYKIVEGKKVPGSIETTVYADVAGESYNGSKTDFTIPGFKGTAKYEGFYGRSTTDIIGGFVGKQKKVDSALLASTTVALKAQIDSKVMQSIASKIPTDFVFIKGGSTIEYTLKPVTPEGDGGLITIESTVRAFVFKKSQINDAVLNASGDSKIASIDIGDYSGLNISNIKVDALKKSLTADLSGNATGLAEIDRDTLAKELAGIKKSEIVTVMNKHPEITESQIYIRLPWMMSLPKNPERIHITEEIDS
jgi:hypothetical protein